MKGVAVGDFLLPTEILARVFQGDGMERLISSVVTTDFVVADRSAIRTVYRLLEENGPSGVPAPRDLAEICEDTGVLAIQICPVSKDTLDRCRDLKLIVSARGGLENIDVKEATRRGIGVINTPHHNAQAVAEYTVGLILAETRNIARSHYELKRGVWRESYSNQSFIPELNELKIGIVGYGVIGSLVADKLRSFRTEVLVADPAVPAEVIEKDGFRPMSLETLLKSADVVTLHVRLSSSTAGMIGHSQIATMKDTAYIINTSRAGLVNMPALLAALRERRIAGAALDVFDMEPIPVDSPLLEIDNLTLSNHRAGDTRNSYWNAPNLMREQMRMFFAGQKPRYLVNPEVLGTPLKA